MPPPRRDHDADLVAAAARRRRKRRRSGGSRGGRRKVWGGLTFVFVILLALGGVAIVGAAVAPTIIRSQCDLSSLKAVKLGTNSFVAARDNSLLGTIPAKRNRQQLTLAQISPWLAKATVAIEDRRFWRHGALDYTGIARAALKDIESGRAEQGASTLTQQLARNLYIGKPSQTLGRKITEACLAMKLADKLSKRDILDRYLNVVYYGNQAYGVGAAAQTYFSKRASQLTVAEAAMIAGLPQAPTLYDPLRDADAALRRRNEVLDAMLATSTLKPAAWRYARTRPLGLKPGTLYKTIHEPYFFGYVDQALVQQYGQQLVESGGLRVRTTIDPKLQALAQRTIAQHLPGRQDPASALVAIDPRNGKLRAMAVWVPSRERLQFNLASQGHRQAGSAFKPFTLAAALEHGTSLYSYFSGPSELTIDDPACRGAYDAPWDVHNNADEAEGTMNLIDATANSVNTIFAQLVSQVGPPAVVRMAHRLGIQSDLKAYCSITLGTQAVSPLEMTSAYATLANHGVRHDPQPVESVRTASGETVPYPVSKPRVAVSRQIADEVTYALEAVTQKGTGTGAAIGRPIAGKTGTAEKYVDAWFCGYVPQLATCVWVGYPHREIPMNYVEGYAPVYGGTIPASIWHDFMEGALAHTPVQDFVTPEIAQPRTYSYTQPSYSYTEPTTTTATTTQESTTTTTTSR
ncbi:MAG TPA: transglycosylase domain-containing protein [Gaiellaceae bacterium]|nr:transglycosylase domain-containing protein [Gaiellaceae bacterium]